MPGITIYREFNETSTQSNFRSRFNTRSQAKRNQHSAINLHTENSLNTITKARQGSQHDPPLNIDNSLSLTDKDTSH